MYTNGFTGQKYLSLVVVKDCAGRTADVLTTHEFADYSEHVTLTTAPNNKVFYRDDAASLTEFTGV